MGRKVSWVTGGGKRQPQGLIEMLEDRRLLSAPPAPSLSLLSASATSLTFSYSYDGASTLSLEEQSPGDVNYHLVSGTWNTQAQTVVVSGLHAQLNYSFRLRAELACEVSYGATTGTTTTASDDPPGDHSLATPSIGPNWYPYPYLNPPPANIPIGCHYPSPTQPGGTIWSQARWDDLPSFMGKPIWGLVDPQAGILGPAPSNNGGDAWFGTHPGFSYSVRIYESDSTGSRTSMWSSAYSGTTSGTQTPGATNVSATATTAGGVDLSWSGTPGMYVVIGGDSAGDTMTQMYVTYQGMPLHLGGLAPGIWQFGVMTQTSALATSSPVVVGLPATPTNLHATIGSAKDKVRLCWDNAPNNESGFNVQYKVTPSGTWIDGPNEGADTTTAELQLPGDYAGKTYDVRLWAYNALGSSGSAQTTTSGIALKDVNFDGYKLNANGWYEGSNFQTVARDTGGTYSGPQWYDPDYDGYVYWPQGVLTWRDHTVDGDGGHSYPISYSRSTDGGSWTISAFSTFVYPAGSHDHWLMKAYATGYSFTQSEPQAVGGGVGFSSQSLVDSPNKIQDSTLSIMWKLSTDNGSSWIVVGTSQNNLFVTGVPANGQLETVLDLACDAGKGLDPSNPGDASTIISNEWGKFAGPANVSRVDQTPLKYYGNWLNVNTTAASLLQTRDGQCTAWCDLFLNALQVDGVQDAQLVRLVPNPQTQAMGFLVNNWSFPAGQAFVNVPWDDTYNYNDARLPGLDDNGTMYHWLVPAQVQDATGAPGQRTADPLSLFGSHYVVMNSTASGFTYYDPSYGKPYTSLAQFDAQAIAGYFQLVRMSETAVGIDFNSDGILSPDVTHWVYLIKPNTTPGNGIVEATP